MPVFIYMCINQFFISVAFWWGSGVGFGSQLENLGCLGPRIQICLSRSRLTHQRLVCLWKLGACWTSLALLVGRRKVWKPHARSTDVEWHCGAGATPVIQITPLHQPHGLTAKEVKQWVQAQRAVSLKSLGTLRTQKSLHWLGSLVPASLGSSRKWHRQLL